MNSETSYLAVTSSVSTENDVNSLPAIMAVVFISVVSVASFLILPLLISAVSDAFTFDNQQLGYLSSSILIGSALSSVLAAFWVRKFDWQKAAFISLLLMLLGHVCAYFLDSIEFLVIAFACAGIGGGAAYSLALTILSEGKKTVKNFAYALAGQVSFQTMALLFLPDVISSYSLSGVLTLLMLLDVLAVFVAMLLPRAGRSNKQKSMIREMLKPALLFALSGCLLFSLMWVVIGPI